MKIISFSWTTEALLQGKKTVTRRDWSPKYAKWFKVGDLVQAYDRSPRFKGKQIAIIRILDIWQEQLRNITDRDEKLEGGLWGNAQNFINTWLRNYPDFTQHSLLWRIEFELISKDKI